jgi:hypothetical protein
LPHQLDGRQAAKVARRHGNGVPPQVEWSAAEGEETIVSVYAIPGGIAVLVVTAPARGHSTYLLPLPAATPQQPPFSPVAGEPGRNTIRHKGRNASLLWHDARLG